jgi:GAF domain-containing protein
MLFLHDADKEVMRSMVATGVRNEQLTLPIGRGILGKTWVEGKVYNLADAFQDYHFDATFDLETGYRTSSLVSVPVTDARNRTIGVCQFLNKKDGKPFSTADIRYTQIVAMLIGLMIDNVRMFATSTKATVQLDSLISSCDHIASGDQLKAIMSELIGNAKVAVDAERASLFSLDEVVSTLSTYVSDELQMPPTIPVSHGIGAESIIKFRELIEEKMSLAEARKGSVRIVNDPYHDPGFNKMIDYHTKFKTKSVCAVPVISTKGVALGVLEVVNKRSPEGFMGSDGRMLTSFANLAAVALENQKLTDLLGNGEAQIEMQKWIGELEFETYEMPGRFKLPVRKMEELHMRDWDAMEWNGIGLFKVCFNLFQSFTLLQRFQVHNYLFFTFLYHVRERYHDHPYHNWIHAVDVLQFTAYQIQRCQFADILTGVEIFAVFVAALVHDINHPALDNRYLIASSHRSGILYKDAGSCNEYGHCSQLIDIVSNPRSNIFHAIQGADERLLWNYIVKIILATDPQNHGKVIRSGNELLDEGPVNLRNPVHRLLALKLLVKAANVANMCRTVELAQQWWSLYLEECYRQGHNEDELELPHSSPLNDKTNPSDESGILFMENNCLPLLTVVSRMFPELEETVTQVRSHIARWKDELKRAEASTAKAKG